MSTYKLFKAPAFWQRNISNILFSNTGSGQSCCFPKRRREKDLLALIVFGNSCTGLKRSVAPLEREKLKNLTTAVCLKISREDEGIRASDGKGTRRKRSRLPRAALTGRNRTIQSELKAEISGRGRRLGPYAGPAQRKKLALRCVCSQKCLRCAASRPKSAILI